MRGRVLKAVGGRQSSGACPQSNVEPSRGCAGRIRAHGSAFCPPPPGRTGDGRARRSCCSRRTADARARLQQSRTQDSRSDAVDRRQRLDALGKRATGPVEINTRGSTVCAVPPDYAGSSQALLCLPRSSNALSNAGALDERPRTDDNAAAQSSVPQQVPHAANALDRGERAPHPVHELPIEAAGT